MSLLPAPWRDVVYWTHAKRAKRLRCCAVAALVLPDTALKQRAYGGCQDEGCHFFNVLKGRRSNCCEVAGRCGLCTPTHVCNVNTKKRPQESPCSLCVQYCVPLDPRRCWCGGWGRHLPLPRRPVEMSLGKSWGTRFLFAPMITATAVPVTAQRK